MKDKSLKDNYLFWLPLAVGVVISLVSVLLMSTSVSSTFCISAQCFSNFLIMYAFPVKVMSGALIVSGFVAVVHRSEQTKYQIDISISQNVFKNYIDHKKEFIDILEKLESGHDVVFKNKTGLYNNIFPFNSVQNVEFDSRGKGNDEPHMKNLLREHNKSIQGYNELVKFPANEHEENYLRWLSNYLWLCQNMGLYPSSVRKMSKKYEGRLNPGVFSGIPVDLHGFMYATYETFVQLLKFSSPSDNKHYEDYVEFRNGVSSQVNAIFLDFCEPEPE